MTKCKFYNERKNYQLLWDLSAGIARDAKKTNGYYGNYMRVLQGMQNSSGYYGIHMRVLQGM
jgi:RNA binding exosome subunit